MFSAALLRDRLEAVLNPKIPGALSPKPRIVRQFLSTGIPGIDELLQGGFPMGAITEIVGAECSGRTSLALSFVAGLTRAGKVGAWVDVSDSLHPESAAAAGVDLPNLLWVRCGAKPSKATAVPHPVVLPESHGMDDFAVPEKYFVPRPVKKGLYGGGFGPHPRGEVKGLPDAIVGLFKEGNVVRSNELPRKTKSAKKKPECNQALRSFPNKTFRGMEKPWSRLDQALRTTDLLLQNGGFAAIVLDMGGIMPVHALRVPLATWFRFRAVAEQKQTAVVFLLQHPCAKSSATLTLRLHAGRPRNEATVFAGVNFWAEIERQRFSPDPENVVMLRKPPRTQQWAHWHNRAAWTGR